MSRHINYKEIECSGPDGCHEYSAKVCSQCGTVFCLSCCSDYQFDDNDQLEWMACPGCGDPIWVDLPESADEEDFIEEEMDDDDIIFEPFDIPINPDDILSPEMDEVPNIDFD